MSKNYRLGSFLLVILSSAVAFALLEIGSIGYLFITNKQSTSKAELQSTLDQASHAAVQKILSAQETSPTWMRDHVLHPYLGFVRNHDKDRHIFNDQLVQEPVNKFGFFGNPPVPENDQSKLVVGIFGGSVAAELYLYGGKLLQKHIEQLPIARGKSVELVSVALGGMKQPQQLLALNYLLVTGHRFDIVINVDGFNEVALPFSENIPFGVATSFPRNWRVYSAKSIPARAVQIAGKAQDCRDKLASRRAFFSREWVRESYFALALWQAIYRRTTKECSDREMELRMALRWKGDLGFQERGPFGKSDYKSRVFTQSASIWEKATIMMWQICKDNGIRYLHILQPNQYVENSKTFTVYEKQNAISAPNHPYRIGAERGYPLLRKAGAKLKQIGVPFFDLTMIFRDEPGNIYKDKCCHLNHDGNVLFATRIAELAGLAQSGSLESLGSSDNLQR